MYLCSAAKILFFLLFEFNDVSRTRAIRWENDITIPLEKLITSLFATDIESLYKPNNHTYKLPYYKNNASHHPSDAEFANNNNVGFSDIEMSIFTNLSSLVLFSKNETRIIFKKLEVNVRGYLKTAAYAERGYFDANLAVGNVTLIGPKIASTSAIRPRGLEISHNWSYTYGEFTLESAKYGNNGSIYTAENEKLAFRYEIPFIFELMLRQNIDHIASRVYSKESEMILNHPDLPINHKKCFYLIPRINILDNFFLNHIFIEGLSNLNCFKIREEQNALTFTLLIKHIKGTMMHYKRGNVIPLKLKFKIKRIFITKKSDTNCIFVQARFCNITQAETNVPLTGVLADVMRLSIELAIETSIFPSTKSRQTCDTPDGSWEDRFYQCSQLHKSSPHMDLITRR